MIPLICAAPQEETQEYDSSFNALVSNRRVLTVVSSFTPDQTQKWGVWCETKGACPNYLWKS